MIYLYNGDSFEKCSSMEAAMAGGAECINIARDCCDPEWPDWVESIAIYDAPDGCEYPNEDGKRLAISRMTNIRDAEDGDDCDFWCEYEMQLTEEHAAA